MDHLVAILPERLRPRAKAVVAFVAAVLIIVSLVIPDVPNWVPALVAALNVLGVHETPNVKPSDPEVGCG